MADLKHVCPCDPRKAVAAVGGKHLRSVFESDDDEEVCRVARGHEPMRVEHQRLVGAGGISLDAGGDVVELAVRVELGVERVRRGATDMSCKERDAVAHRRGERLLVFGDDHDGCGPGRHARILVGRALDATGDHQAHVHAVRHLVGLKRRVDRLGQLAAAAADVEHDRLRALEEAVEMALEEHGMARSHPQALPDAVTEDETRVEHRHDRPRTRHELAVDPDQNALVARVVLEVVRAVDHGSKAYGARRSRYRSG